MAGLSYKDAGVDIDAGNNLVDKIKPLAAATKRLGVDSELGGFGALFDLTKLDYKEPVLVSATDGVGTKLKLAIDSGIHNTVGIDLVAMCVNDLIVQGAEPLFFLDYFACGKLDVEHAAAVVEGIAEGCKQAGCALIGGETAEMPGMYADSDYDLAGFAVGAVEKTKILPAQINSGDAIIALPSDGIHSNGFSLVRKVMEIEGFDIGVEELMKPTKIYVKELLPLIKQGLVKGLAHITGGGLTENIPRICGAEINLDSWDLTEIFKKLQKFGEISDTEMLKTFNCGVGMVVICAQENKQKVLEQTENSFEIGNVTNGTEVVYR